jgi:hypothetical protein
MMRRGLVLIAVIALAWMLMPTAATAQVAGCSKNSPVTVKLTEGDSFGTQICSFTVTCPTAAPCDLTVRVDVSGVGKPSAAVRIGSAPPSTCSSTLGCSHTIIGSSFTGTVPVTCWTPALAGTIAVGVNITCTVSSSTGFVH